MKKYLLISALLLTTQSSFANCYKFINNKGPQSIAGIDFQGESAKRMCLENVSSITGNVSHSLSLLDDQGVISQMSSSTLLKGRCGTTCFGLELESGSILGQNVLLDKKVSVIITLSTDQHLNLTTGTVDFGEGQKYLIMQETN